MKNWCNVGIQDISYYLDQEKIGAPPMLPTLIVEISRFVGFVLHRPRLKAIGVGAL